ncbi:ABC transporter permease subunit [Streptococcus orisasini]
MADFFHSLLEIIKVVPYTLILAVLILVLGLILGSLIAFLASRGNQLLHFITHFYISYVRGVPIVVQLFIAQAAIPKIALLFLKLIGKNASKVEIPSVVIVLVCYVFYEGAVESENIRGIFKAFDFKQYEAGLSIGMTPDQVLRRIVVPQLFYTAFPILINAFLKIMRTLSVAFLVGIVEIMASARYTAALSSDYIASYVAAAIIYWGVCLIMQFLVKVYLARNYRYL